MPRTPAIGLVAAELESAFPVFEPHRKARSPTGDVPETDIRPASTDPAPVAPPFSLGRVQFALSKIQSGKSAFRSGIPSEPAFH
jgi:hypothetical protein